MEENMEFGPMNVEEQIFTITFSDGSQIVNLKMSGNTFISQTPVTESTFAGKLDEVTFTDGYTSNKHGAMTLVDIQTVGNETHFVLRDLTQMEILEMNVRGDVDFLAMMSGVDMNG